MTDNTETTAEYVSDQGTAYTLQVERIRSHDNGAFERRDISTPFTLYTIFTGPEVYSHHDKYKLIRELPGDASWLHDHFDRLEEQMR